jgi:hypothetical protein
MEHLQGMGEGNAALRTRTAVSRDTFLAAAALYQLRHGTPDGTVTATFQVQSLFNRLAIALCESGS